MNWLMNLFFFLLLMGSLKGQTINKAMLAKYSQRTEQEKIIDQQVALLHLPPQQATAFKALSFYYADKALVIVNANLNSSTYGLYRKLKPIKDEHEAAIKRLLTAEQMEVWEAGRKRNGIVAQIIR